jgi:hypothetical protein
MEEIDNGVRGSDKKCWPFCILPCCSTAAEREGSRGREHARVGGGDCERDGLAKYGQRGAKDCERVTDPTR